MRNIFIGFILSSFIFIISANSNVVPDIISKLEDIDKKINIIGLEIKRLNQSKIICTELY